MDPTTFATYLGYIAAILTTGSFLPQALRVIRTRDTQSISLTMYIVLVIGIFLWLVYGIILEQWPIILANAVTGILASVILVYKFREKKSN